MVKVSPTWRAGVAACAAAVVVTVSACAPGSASKPSAAAQGAGEHLVANPAKLGKVTIIEWDKNTLAGPNLAMQEINRRFHSLHPNITIHRVARDFNDLKATLKLALSSGSPPDVLQVNQGYGDLGAFAHAGLLRPVDRYSAEFGWASHYPPTFLAQNRATPSGGWATGNLYGIPSTAELVGVYYNTESLAKLGIQPPRTYSEFVADLAKAKAAGMLPIQYGASDQGPAIHIFGTILANVAGPQAVNDLVFDRNGASWTEPAALKALQTLAGWAKRGYIPAYANGQASDRAAANFEKGQGVFFISGSWWGGDFAKFGSKIGFTALVPPGASSPVAMGGPGLLWAIAAGSKHPDADALYINFITGPQAARFVAQAGDLPGYSGGAYAPPPHTLEAELTSSIQEVLKADTLVPYLDYSTPNFYDVLSAQIQQLTAGRRTPQQAASALRDELKSFKASQ